MNYQMPRGALARAIYVKYHNDYHLDKYNTRLWYCIDSNEMDTLGSYGQLFVALNEPDLGTLKWLEKAKNTSTKIWMHLWHDLARMALRFFMTQTDINGFLKRGSMFILSEQQFALLLRHAGFNQQHQLQVYQQQHLLLPQPNCRVAFLDIGAGDGEITLVLLKALRILHPELLVDTYATEASWTMRERLKKRHFHVLERLDELNSNSIQLIACLNVLDRCIDPIALLRDIHRILTSDGLLLLALVLPYMHYVESNTSHMPIRPLMDHWPGKAKHYSFETEASLFFNLLEQIGFRVESWTKAPYLCEGDLRQSYYWLVDLVVIVSKVS